MIKITIKERREIIRWANTLSNKELEDEYYTYTYESLGTKTERMYDLGYDMVDIEKRAAYEKYIREKADILEYVCEKRGIKLWVKGIGNE